MRSPTPKYSYHKWRKDHGGAMVEFAIVLPLLLILVFGIIEFGILFYNKSVLANASREGARMGIIEIYDNNGTPTDGSDDKYYYPDKPDIASVVINYCSDHLISFSPNPEIDENNINVSWTIPPDGVSERTYPDVFSGDFLTVTVNYNYEFLIFSKLIKLVAGQDWGNISLKGETVMKLE